ncbi:AMP deaminase 3 [Branchiostoma belcheri]|nr:AMP deaminase 3 [Branchiostoma belcheri]
MPLCFVQQRKYGSPRVGVRSGAPNPAPPAGDSRPNLWSKSSAIGSKWHNVAQLIMKRQKEEAESHKHDLFQNPPPIEEKPTKDYEVGEDCPIVFGGTKEKHIDEELQEKSTEKTDVRMDYPSIQAPYFLVRVSEATNTDRRKSRKFLKRAMTATSEGTAEPSASSVPMKDRTNVEYQRVLVDGEGIAGVPLRDLQDASKGLLEALAIREKYMRLNFQSYPKTTSRYLRMVDNEPTPNESDFTGVDEEESRKSGMPHGSSVFHNWTDIGSVDSHGIINREMEVFQFAREV